MGKDILSREELKTVNQNIKSPCMHRKQILPLFLLNFFPICISTVYCIKYNANNIPFKNNNILFNTGALFFTLIHVLYEFNKFNKICVVGSIQEDVSYPKEFLLSVLALEVTLDLLKRQPMVLKVLTRRCQLDAIPKKSEYLQTITALNNVLRLPSGLITMS